MNKSYKNQIELENKLRKLKTPETAFPAKVMKKINFCQKIQKPKLQERMTTHA